MREGPLLIEKTYDLVVIGAGPGGYVAAIRAAQLGMKAACVDKSEFGGTCLNIGCIPSKALLDSSELFYETNHSFQTHGIKAGQVELDLPAMMKRKDKIVQTMTRGITGLFKKNKVEGIHGHARLKDGNTVEVQTQDGPLTLNAKRIVLAAGSVPFELPNLPFDGAHIVSSKEALEFDRVPNKMVVIGAGAIGLEMGSVWSRLGTEVLVVEMMDRAMPVADQEVSKQLKKLLEKQGMKFLLSSKATSYEVKKDTVHLKIETPDGEQEETCDKVLVAVGRRALSEELGLDSAGVKTNKKGQVIVNENFETDVSGIYAIGDLIGGAMLAHKAEEEGVAAVEHMAGMPCHINYDAVPNVVYTHPEVAWVGVTEEQAKEREIPYKVGKFPFMANGRAHALGSTDGFVKIISHSETDRMLGMHILAPRASDIIAEGALAMEYHASSEDIARTCHAHPTLPEAIKEAALGVDKRSIHI